MKLFTNSKFKSVDTGKPTQAVDTPRRCL